jgi:hypothetical protein
MELQGIMVKFLLMDQSVFQDVSCLADDDEGIDEEEITSVVME